MRTEILGITITREELENFEGRIRLFWVLRNEGGHIVYISRTFEGLLHEMMWDTIEFNKV